MARFSVVALSLALSCDLTGAIENVTATLQCPGAQLANCLPLATCATTILEAFPAWAGDCEGLGLETNALSHANALACKAACAAQFNCSVWQFSNYKNGIKSTAVPPLTYCYTGVPTADCRTRASFKSLGAERVQRGAVKVMNSSVRMEIVGLHKFSMDYGTDTQKIQRCRDECYSNIHCGVWQYAGTVGNGHTTSRDCYVERYGYERSAIKQGTPLALKISNGEFIIHYCPTASPPVKPKKKHGLPWKWIIPGILGGLAALASIMFCLQPVPKVKKTRAVKISPKDEEEEPAKPLYFVPQPSVLIPQPVQTVQPMRVEPVQTVQTVQTRMEPRVTYEPVQSVGTMPVSGTMPVQPTMPTMPTMQSQPLLSPGSYSPRLQGFP